MDENCTFTKQNGKQTSQIIDFQSMKSAFVFNMEQ